MVKRALLAGGSLPALGLATAGTALGQATPISITTNSDATNLAQRLIGDSGISLVSGSAQYTGSSSAAGTFTGNGGALNFSKGVIFSTGSLATGGSQSLGTAGDSTLSAAVGSTTFDAASLQFQFVPTSNKVSFQFVFGSNEYPEFVGQFNDGFLLLVNGQNVALLPGTSTPVSINNVNANSNSKFFTDNAGRTIGINADGLVGLPPNTLVATATVTPGQPNTFKLVIGDAKDSVVDSIVLLSENGIVLGELVLVDSTQLSAQQQSDAIKASNTEQVRTIVRVLSGSIRNRIASLRTSFSPTRAAFDTDDAEAGGRQQAFALPSGLSGGDFGAVQFGLWTDTSVSRTLNTRDAGPFNARNLLWQVGGDANLNGRLVLGAGFGVDTSEINSSSSTVSRDVKGYLGTVYVAYMVTDWLTATGFASYGTANNDVMSQNAAGTDVEGSGNSTRAIGGIEAAAYHSAYGFNFTGTVGYSAARERFSTYTASDNSVVSPEETGVQTVRIGGEAAYPIDEGEVYAGASVEHELHPTEGEDGNGGVVNVGFRSKLFDGAYLGLQASTEVYRSNEQQYELSGSLRFTF